MILSEHFTLEELTHSDVAARKNIDNTPDADVLENLKLLALGLERVRAVLSVPLLVSSGYRSPKLNSAIGGSKTSSHMKGLAADFIAPRFGSPREIFDALRERKASLDYDQIILEFDRWVHIGFAEEAPRGEALAFDGKAYVRVA